MALAGVRYDVVHNTIRLSNDDVWVNVHVWERRKNVRGS
jgi:hypothetical protein